MPRAPSQQQHSRINISQLKAQIMKKLGPDRSFRYFNCLNRFLSQKLGKSEFDKLCFLALGRENLPLHNQLIRSILKNAFHGRVAPPAPEKVPNSVKVGGKRSPKVECKPLPIQSAMPPPLILPNGDILPSSPRKIRSGIRDRKFKDRPSPLGRNEEFNPSSHPLVADDEAVEKSALKNWDWNSCDLQRPMLIHQGPAEQPGSDQEISLLHSAKRPRVNRSPDGMAPVHSKCTVDGVVVKDEHEAEHAIIFSSKRSPLQAPLGIPFCSASVGGARRTLPVTSSSGSYANSVDCSELPDTESLKKRMEQITYMMGLNEVSMDSANLLNSALDVYLKQLISTCVDLFSGKSVQEISNNSMNKFSHRRDPIDGILPNHMVLQSCSETEVISRESRPHCPISLQHFRVAMELKPQLLGEDWPLLLEKICLRSCED